MHFSERIPGTGNNIIQTLNSICKTQVFKELSAQWESRGEVSEQTSPKFSIELESGNLCIFC